MKKVNYFISLMLCAAVVLPASIEAKRKRHDTTVYITSSEISGLERSGRLVPAGTDAWKTRSGLLIAGRDPEGRTRLNHIMKHTKDSPGRARHGVFVVSKAEVLDLMDEAWSAAKSGNAEKSERGGRAAYTARFGKTIGYLGGKEGRTKGYPKLNAVRLVVVTNGARVVTFFPL